MKKQSIHGTSNTPQTSPRTHAIVLGGSLAGLLTARVLCDHFQQVTLIERDAFPTEAEARRGTPQANHVHALMPKGRAIVEKFFPDLTHTMVGCGAPVIDMAKDIAWLTPQGWGLNFSSTLSVLAFTRPLLDLNVRRLLFANPRLSVSENTEIVGLLANGENVLGVTLRKTEADGSTSESELKADLVVDATGRASRAPRWLESIGFSAPSETVINAHLGYASRLYRIPEGFTANWKCAYVQVAPPEQRRGGILFRVEGNRWLVTMIGGGHDYPPKDEIGFLDFARSLADPIIYDAIRDAEPLSAIRVHRGTENRLRHYEKLKRLPNNFIALGDSVCAFNPVYGQGMTVAAMGALMLDECLRNQKGDFKGFAKEFQKRLTKVTLAPWMMATGEDYRFRETEGGKPNFSTRFMHGYIDRVVKLATFNRNVRLVLLSAFGMLVQPTALFRPGILFRVIKSVLKGSKGPDWRPVERNSHISFERRVRTES